MPQDQLELKFLRYFFRNARDGMGPADGEIYDMIKRDFVTEGNTLPVGYELEDEEYPDEGDVD